LENEKLVCLNCEFLIKKDDDYCPNCGTIFSENIKCTHHIGTEAEGVCLICLQPFCKKCGLVVNNVFLCDKHSNYEIIEGMGRIYGSNDFLELSYFKEILEKEELHPFLYSRKSSPISLGGVDYSLFRASGEFDGHLINEIKLMVPLSEIIAAEKLLKPLI
jgi:RNA polymerase subunit RPABC4/transcription elongation factor Spt4